jgi:ribosome-binding factor A
MAAEADAYVVLLLIHLHFPDAGSLKAKRRDLSSIKAQLHGRMGVSVAEVGHQDLWQRATLAASMRAAASSGRSHPSTRSPHRRPCRRITRMTSDRMRRVDEAVRQVLSDAVTQDLQDPRIGFVTMTSVKTSTDLRHARVYVSVLGDDAQRVDTLAGLESARGALQRRLARELRMKHTPTLEFVYDDTIDRAMRLEDILEREVGEG